MLDSNFFITLGSIVLFTFCFLMFGYLSYKKGSGGSKAVGKVFLLVGIVSLGGYIYLMTNSIISGNAIAKVETNNQVKQSKEVANISGLNGSLGNGSNGTYEYPSEPEIQAILSKGDSLLVQNSIDEAIKEFKAGLKDEKFKDIFEKRIDHANQLKRDYKVYQRGLEYFNKQNYDKSYEEFKNIKPSDTVFYKDVEEKMSQISSGMLVNDAEGNNQEGATVQGTDQKSTTNTATAQVSNSSTNTSN